ncbi:Urease accessory protein UreD [Methylobacterium sp. 4-46]|uniref:Urease accessory protein UreD n=1 Tax=Methylobacterium sp. (strain 4-46) TaxID=426117 RepID=URED_METS4|nr:MULTISPECIES: urease accessory protein UreD [Methylobacterium]B0UDF4.1 RecName: Full=Urease accessory protein UreD [Methylobacterium sp. 4-46]ACA16675.1 Urease accessory protein UreD [Methylobacterium sp. 4-46]WFT82377.1 urease accessory protein UreD [Methylobacterium nodulans]
MSSHPTPSWPRRQRSEGRVALGAGLVAGGTTRLTDLAETGPLRLRLPRVEGAALEGVLLNSAGGLACGDRFAVAAEIGEGADMVLTTTAAEKIYRSDGPVTEIAAELRLGPRARLAWLPQETILYDGARLSRRLTAEIAPDAALTLFEALVFGRSARGETVREGEIRDAWRLARGGRLVYADTLRLDGAVAAHLARPAIAGGARAVATLVHAAPDAESRLDGLRGLIAAAGCAALGVEAGASAWNGLLVLRLLAPESAPLRRAATRILEGFRGLPLPRVWQT